MTTEAVELTCGVWVDAGVPWGDRVVDISGFCDKPIRQRTSGPCCERREEEHVTQADRERWPNAYIDHDYDPNPDPGYDHVDLEGACAECGRAQTYHLERWPNPAVASMPLEDHPFVPPVLPLSHEATV